MKLNTKNSNFLIFNFSVNNKFNTRFNFNGNDQIHEKKVAWSKDKK